jgi:hypothetical protein
MRFTLRPPVAGSKGRVLAQSNGLRCDGRRIGVGKVLDTYGEVENMSVADLE